MWTPPTCGPHCGNLSSDLQTPIQPRSNMLSLDMFGTELRPTETLRTGKDHYSMWRWQCQCHCYNQCTGIIYHLSSILMRSFQPSSVGQPTSSLVPFSHFSTLVLSGKKIKAAGEMSSSDSWKKILHYLNDEMFENSPDKPGGCLPDWLVCQQRTWTGTDQ